MSKLLAVVCVACSFLFSGCAAVIQGGAAMAAGGAKSHPANQSFEVSTGKNDVFNISMRALTASGRKVTSSDREAGIVQGELGDYAVMIKIAGKSSKVAVVDITVAYNQSFIYGTSKVEEVMTTVKGEIEAGAVKAVTEDYSVKETVVDTSVTEPVVVAPVKTKRKKAPAKTTDG